MDILLVNAPVKTRSKHARLNPPLGLAYIASVLLKNGYRVAAEDFNVTGFNPVRAEKILENSGPSILGISVHTETYPNGLRIAEIAKRVNPDTTVVMGGPHATVLYREVARERDIDIVVRGEGEVTMRELADCLLRGKGSLAEVKGIAYKKDGEITVTPERPFIGDPDELPFPARELFPLPMYELPGQVLMSRGGCPFDCHFCAVNTIWKGDRRFRSPDPVVKEILSLFENFQLEEISFADDTFTLNREHVLRLCEQSRCLRDRFPWRWRCTTRVDRVDNELLEVMHEAGCYSITFGVETGSQKILESIGKKIRREQVIRAVGTSLDSGLEVLCSFMFPHPEDTEETVREQKLFMKQLIAMGATVSMALTTPLPGTYYYEHADDLGITLLTDRWDEFDAKHLVITTKYLSEERLNTLLEEVIQDLGMRMNVPLTG